MKQPHLIDFFNKLNNMDNEQIAQMIEQYLTDDDIEIIVDHIQEFYGIEDDEELGMLAQLVVTGYVAASSNQSMNAQ